MAATNQQQPANNIRGQEQLRTVDLDDWYSNLRYNIGPPACLVFFTFLTQILVVVGNPNLSFGFGFLFSFFTGLFSLFAWKGK